MKRLLPHRAVTLDPEGGPCRRLAVRIIVQAFRDLESPGGLRCDRASARVFLAGSSMLDHWCAVADLDPVWLTARAKELTTAPRGKRQSRTTDTSEN